MPQTYRVHLDTAPLALTHDIEHVLDGFAEAVQSQRRLLGPSASANTLLRRIGLTTSVAAQDPAEAMTVAQEAFMRALARAGVKEPVVSEASLELEANDDGEDRQELLGTPALADRLGVSRERVRQLLEQPGRFPRPVAEVRGTSVWRWGDVADWIAAGAWKRTPGRAKDVEALDDLDLLTLADPSRGPSDEGRRARLELGRRGFTAWESGFQRADRLTRRGKARSLREIYPNASKELLVSIAERGEEFDPNGLAAKELYRRGLVSDGHGGWAPERDSGRGPGIAVGRSERTPPERRKVSSFLTKT